MPKYLIRLTKKQLELMRDLAAFAARNVDTWVITFANAPRHKEEIRALQKALLEAEEDSS